MKFGLSDEIYNKIINIIKKYDYTFKIFGSRARGDYNYNSDIDIAVYGEIKEADKFNISNDFDKIDIAYTIDLIFIQDVTKEKFLNSINRDGVEL